MKYTFLALFTVLFLGCKNDAKSTIEVEKETTVKTTTSEMKWDSDTLIYPEEKHFKNIRQVTFGGDNAEAYWSFDDKQLVFQSNNKAWV